MTKWVWIVDMYDGQDMERCLMGAFETYKSAMEHASSESGLPLHEFNKFYHDHGTVMWSVFKMELNP